MTTNLGTFNTTLKEFMSNLINTFPQTQNEILNHYRPLLENGEYDPLQYCNDFMHRAKEYQKDIANKIIPAEPKIGFSHDDLKNLEAIKGYFKDKESNLTTYSTAGGVKKQY